MKASRSKSPAFACKSCGALFPKWMGKCHACGELNSVEEQSSFVSEKSEMPLRLKDLPADEADAQKFAVAIPFLDRVMGGGVARGTVVLLAGEPGIGKSTLLFQMMAAQSTPVLYVSGEESTTQIARRFRKLPRAQEESLYVISECRLAVILQQIERVQPSVVVIDSIQMMIAEDDERSRGGAASLRDICERLVHEAKAKNFVLWIVGHVNKEGDVAGPKTLEHLVDVVLLFSMAEDSRLRILQAQKNRFGPSGELALLEIDETGLKEKRESDSYWIQSRRTAVPGCALAAVILGSRALCVEVQALVVDSYFPSPRRSTSGFDINRLYLLLAVLEKRLKIPFSRSDVYLNVVGGLKLQDPGADLAVAAALVSAHTEKPVTQGVVYCGEIGLTGELRVPASFRERVRAAAHHRGFVSPQPREVVTEGLKVKPCDRLDEALDTLL